MASRDRSESTESALRANTWYKFNRFLCVPYLSSVIDEPKLGISREKLLTHRIHGMVPRGISKTERLYGKYTELVGGCMVLFLSRFLLNSIKA